MIDVGDNDPVDLAGRELRVNRCTQDRHDAGDVLFTRPLGHDLEHLGLNVLAVDGPAGLHERRDLARVVARATPDISHDIASLQSHRVEHTLWLFLDHPLFSFEPFGTEIAHELGGHTVPLLPVGLGPTRSNAGHHQGKNQEHCQTLGHGISFGILHSGQPTTESATGHGTRCLSVHHPAASPATRWCRRPRRPTAWPQVLPSGSSPSQGTPRSP